MTLETVGCKAPSVNRVLPGKKVVRVTKDLLATRDPQGILALLETPVRLAALVCLVIRALSETRDHRATPANKALLVNPGRAERVALTLRLCRLPRALGST